MVKLSVENKTISVTKAVEREIVEFLNSCKRLEHESKEVLKRIYAWQKDFHIADMFTNSTANTVTLVRKLDKDELTSVDTEVVSQAMRDIMMDFVNFIYTLKEESKEDNSVKQESDEEDEYVSITRNKNGNIAVEGNMHPLTVISIMLKTISRLQDEKSE